MPDMGRPDRDVGMSEIQLPATRSCRLRSAEDQGPVDRIQRPLPMRHFWANRACLELAVHCRDLARLGFAIDSALRDWDLVRLRVGDLVIAGSVRVSVIQSETGRPVRLEVSENT